MNMNTQSIHDLPDSILWKIKYTNRHIRPISQNIPPAPFSRSKHPVRAPWGGKLSTDYFDFHSVLRSIYGRCGRFAYSLIKNMYQKNTNAMTLSRLMPKARRGGEKSAQLPPFAARPAPYRAGPWRSGAAHARALSFPFPFLTG